MSPKNFKYIIGIDEVGRGPLAGPVTVGAFCVETKKLKEIKKILTGITDSKQLSLKQREYYYQLISGIKKSKRGGNFAVSHVSAKIIDQKGIIHAINVALERSLTKLGIQPEECFVYLDGGLHAPKEYVQETIIKGDQKVWQISAASVVAKVLRDRKMVHYAKEYPSYRFDLHKGYGTRFHREQIQKKGVTDIHRKTWIKI